MRIIVYCKRQIDFDRDCAYVLDDIVEALVDAGAEGDSDNLYERAEKIFFRLDSQGESV